MRLWNSKINTITAQAGPAPYGRKLALLGLITVTLLTGGVVLTLPMPDTNPDPHPEAAISLKSAINTQAEPVSVPSVTVNGQAVPVSSDGAMDQVIPTGNGNVTIHTDASSTDNTAQSNSSLNIDMQGSGSVNATTEIKGGSSTVNILSR